MKVKVKSKKGLISIVVIAIILGVMFAICLINNKISKSDKTIMEYLRQVLNVSSEENEKMAENKNSTKDGKESIAVLPTMIDNLKSNSIWCPTFQLVWNDMVNEVVKTDVKFIGDEDNEFANNLNKQDFKEDMLSEESFYKTYGLKTLELKEKIETGIKDKFNETSDVLNDIDWSEEALDQEGDDTNRYIFYTMLKKEFNFENEFSILEPSSFGNKTKNIKYFGVDSDTDFKARRQVEVLYYNSDKNFAVELQTAEGDSVILARGENADNFKKVYENIQNNKEKFEGDIYLQEEDTLKIPNLNVDVKKEYTEFQNKIFYSKEGRECEIMKAIQTIKFDLDNKGGKVKSEAIIDMVDTAAIKIDRTKPRHFDFDDEFVIFLKEDKKDVPYFASRISDITLYQK